MKTKTDDDQNKTEASVQASQWDVPAQRPSWALVCDDNARPGVVEVSQLEEDKWISCRHIDLNSSVAGMSAHHYFFLQYMFRFWWSLGFCLCMP